MKSLLRHGGTLVLGTPNEGSLLHRWRIRRLGSSFQTDHVHFYTERDIRKKIEEAGFFIDNVMREVFFLGSDRLYYWLTKRPLGFALLELMTKLWPAGCSDFYFECRPGSEG
jgi:hypothetical protein